MVTKKVQNILKLLIDWFKKNFIVEFIDAYASLKKGQNIIKYYKTTNI